MGVRLPVLLVILALPAALAVWRPQPNVTVVEWHENAWRINVEFDVDTDMYGKSINETIDCSTIMSFPLGPHIGTYPQARCQFLTNDYMLIELGSDATMPVDAKIRFTGGLLQQLYGSETMNQVDWTVSKVNAIAPAAAIVAEPPTSVIGSCQTIKLFGTAGDDKARNLSPYPHYMWWYNSLPGGANVALIQSRILARQNYSSLEFLSTDLASGAYVFKCTVTNIWGLQDVATYSFSVSVQDIPLVEIVGPTSALKMRDVEFAADIWTSPCTVNVTLSYYWSLFGPSGPVQIAAADRTDSNFVIKKQTLEAALGGTGYVVQLNVTFASAPSTVASETASLTLYASVPRLRGFGKGRWAQNSTVVVDYSSTVDPDGESDAVMNFTLNCVKKADSSACYDLQGVRVSELYSTTGIFSYARETFPVDWYKFTVKAWKGLREASTAVEVEIVKGSPARVDIMGPVYAPLAQNAVLLESTASEDVDMYKWSSLSVAGQPTLDLSVTSNLLSKTDEKNLIIAPNALTAGETYSFVLQGWPKDDPDNVGSSQYSLKVDDAPEHSETPPVTAAVRVENQDYPGTGVELTTLYRFYAGVFTVPTTTLRYQFGYQTEDGVNVTLSRRGYSRGGVFMLPAGWKDGNLLPTCLWVYSRSGAVAFHCVDVEVAPLSLTGSKADSLVLEVYELAQKGEVSAAARLINSIATAFNARKDSDWTIRRATLISALETILDKADLSSPDTVEILAFALRALTLNMSQISAPHELLLSRIALRLCDPNGAAIVSAPGADALFASLAWMYQKIASYALPLSDELIPPEQNSTAAYLNRALGFLVLGQAEDMPLGADGYEFTMPSGIGIRVAGRRVAATLSGMSYDFPNGLAVSFEEGTHVWGVDYVTFMAAYFPAEFNPYIHRAGVHTSLTIVTAFQNRTAGLETGTKLIKVRVVGPHQNKYIRRTCVMWDDATQSFRALGWANTTAKWTDCGTYHLSAFAYRDVGTWVDDEDGFPTWAIVLIFFAACGIVAVHVIVGWVLYVNRGLVLGLFARRDIEYPPPAEDVKREPTAEVVEAPAVSEAMEEGEEEMEDDEEGEDDVPDEERAAYGSESDAESVTSRTVSSSDSDSDVAERVV